MYLIIFVKKLIGTTYNYQLLKNHHLFNGNSFNIFINYIQLLINLYNIDVQVLWQKR